jgi:predicted ATPase
VKEKLIIRNFGPIKSVELDLGRFNILIGEQATGKSTVAKLLAVCRYFSYIIDIDDPLQRNFEEGLSAWGLFESIQDDTFISYECKHYSLTVKRITVKEHDRDQEGDYFEYEAFALAPTLTPLSKEFSDLIVRLKELKPKPKSIFETLVDLESINWRIPTSFFQNEVARVMDNPFYLSEERRLQSIFSLGKSSIQNLSDSLFNQFAKLDRIARLFTNETVIEPLDIIYKNENGRGFIKSSKHDFLSLFNAASGYQSTIPIVLLTKYYLDIRRRSKTFIIEEPESGLFPTAQNKLIQYLVDKIMNYGNSMLVTTHAPYILTSLNNLMYAYQVGQTNSEEASKIIDDNYWLNPNDVSAYMMLVNGECEDIMDREEGMIKAEKIDEVSRKLNQQFDDLLTLEYSKK